MSDYDTFTVKTLSYDETTDTISATIAQTVHLGEPVDDDTPITYQIAIGSTDAKIQLTSDPHFYCDFTFAPTVLAAFARAWQNAHNEQNPGDSPVCTTLETFDVTY